MSVTPSELHHDSRGGQIFSLSFSEIYYSSNSNNNFKFYSTFQHQTYTVLHKMKYKYKDVKSQKRQILVSWESINHESTSYISLYLIDDRVRLC